jgi:hypothetical protein
MAHRLIFAGPGGPGCYGSRSVIREGVFRRDVEKALGSGGRLRLYSRPREASHAGSPRAEGRDRCRNLIKQFSSKFSASAASPASLEAPHKRRPAAASESRLNHRQAARLTIQEPRRLQSKRLAVDSIFFRSVNQTTQLLVNKWAEAGQRNPFLRGRCPVSA